jgi:hypothetical protein
MPAGVRRCLPARPGAAKLCKRTFAPVTGSQGSVAALTINDTPMAPLRRLSACMVVLLAAGCYAYVPVEIDQLRPDHDVRARISAEHARELDPVLMRDARVVEGRVVEIDQDLLIQVPVVSEFRGTAVQTLSQRVRVPFNEIGAVELRSLDRTRTGLLVGGGLAVTLALLVHALTGEGGGDTRPTPPPPAEAHVPVILPLLRFVP